MMTKNGKTEVIEEGTPGCPYSSPTSGASAGCSGKPSRAAPR